MKTSNYFVALPLTILVAAISTNFSGAQTAASPVPAPTPYTVVARDAHSAVWERTTYELGPSGQVVPGKQHYTECATGLNFRDPTTGQWTPSKEEIEVSPDGSSAKAVNGQHQVHFPGNIYSGAIRLVTPEGKTLVSQPIGMAYDDGAKSVLIAVLTNATGAILPCGNQVLYQNAFTGFDADLLYTYTKAGFEQCVVIKTEPPTPESLGLNPTTTKLQVLTEFFNPPAPATTATTLPAQAGLSLTDEALDFGIFKVSMGRALMIGDNVGTADVLVAKQWVQVGNRHILVEEVPVEAVANQLGTLPLAPGAAAATGTAAHPATSHQWQLPPPHLAKAGSPGQFKRTVAAIAPQHGLVLDYQTLNSSLTNYVFQGDTTYFVRGPVYLYKTNTFEGGTVIKYTNTSSVTIQFQSGSAIKCQGSAYRPIVMTSMHDNSVGETLPGSSGNPAPGSYTALGFQTSISQSLSHLRVAYAGAALAFYGTGSAISDAQFVNCGYGVQAVNNSSATLENALFSNMSSYDLILYQSGCYVRAVNATFDRSPCLCTASPGGSFYATNCIVANVTNLTSGSVGLSGNYNGFYNSPPFGSNPLTNNFYPFQAAGAGNYYLTNGCNFFNQGTTNIDPALLAELKTKTTHPPRIYSNTNIASATVFSLEVPRDTNSHPDLGYHYDPIDYAVSGVSSSNTIVAVYPGTVIAAFGTSNNAFGLNLSGGTEFLCKGLATNWNRIVAYNTVQEQTGTNWQRPANGLVTDASGNSSSTLDCRFADWSVPAQDEAFIVFSNQTSVALRDCQFHGGSLILDYSTSGGGPDPAIHNCLFERVNFILNAFGGSDFSCQNNLFWHGVFNFAPTTSDAVVQDNLFDQTTIPDNSAMYGTYIGGFNAYVTNCDRLQPVSTNDLILTSPPVYRVGPFGNYYQPSNSPLINAGSTNADQLGLYDYTVLTNLVSGQEIKETNGLVDIGYHYVAVGSNGIPLTTYTNGLPDYLVTSSTDPIPDWWEFIFFGNLDQAADGDYDNDGTNNLTEYQNSTDPNKISFSFLFPNQYVTTNIVTGVITILGGVPSNIAVLVDPDNSTQTNWTAYTSSNITVDIGTNQGSHDVWVGLRGLPANAQQTWEETTLVLDSTSPTIAITSPTDGASFNASRMNVSGNFTAASLRQITVNGIVAFANGTNFEARNVPLAGGANVVTAVIENFTGVTNAASVNAIGTTNADGSMNDPVQLQATPVAGFAPLQVAFQITSNAAPGTLQQVLYDFNGDDIADFVTNDLDSLAYTYETNGEFFPVVTLQTSAGNFSSIGGWNALWLDPINQPIRINVQTPVTIVSTNTIADPVDLKWTGTNLFVLTGSSGTITVFDTNGSPVGTPFSVGVASSGFEVDAAGNVYVALTGSNQVWKFIYTNSSFVADTNFGFGGFIGTTNGAAGTTNGEFNAPFDVAVSPDGGTISVSDSTNNRIQQFAAANGSFIAAFGTNGSDIGQFNAPKGLTYDALGTLYIVDSGNNRLALGQDSVTGAAGADLGQFQNPINVSVGKRGVYVADTGNGRIQKFDVPPQGFFEITPASIGFALSTNLSAPAAVAAVDNPTNELFYVADTGHNRVLLCQLPDNNAGEIQAVWTGMTNCVANGNIASAARCFSSLSEDKYQQAFLALGTTNLIPIINEIGPLTPDYIENNLAEYYFEQTIGGQTITFPVKFIKEDSGWKILAF